MQKATPGLLQGFFNTLIYYYFSAVSRVSLTEGEGDGSGLDIPKGRMILVNLHPRVEHQRTLGFRRLQPGDVFVRFLA